MSPANAVFAADALGMPGGSRFSLVAGRAATSAVTESRVTMAVFMFGDAN